MKASWSATRKVLASITFVALATTGMTVGITSAAHATADNEWSVKTTNVDATDNGWNGDVLGWYGANSRWMSIAATAGGSEVVTYQVQHNGANAGAGVTVHLVAGKAWSGSTAVVTVNSQTTSGGDCWCGNDQAETSATTDSNGQVSFTIDGTSALSTKFTQIYAWVDKKAVSAQWAFDSDTADVIDLHYSAPVVTSEVASIKLDAGDFGTITSNPGNGWWRENGDSNSVVRYWNAGSSISLHYTVKDSNGNPVSGAHIAVQDAKVSGSPTYTGDNTGVTDSDGKVTFTFVNTNTNSESESYRADNTVWSSPSNGEVGVNFVPYVTDTGTGDCYSAGNGACARDRVWSHVVSTEAPAGYDQAYLVAGDKASMSDKSYWWTDNSANHSMVKFVTAGSTLVLHYQVTHSATVDGTYAPVGAGVTVSLSAADAGVGATYTGSLSATTNSSGIATFTLVNTDASGESRPSAPSTMSFWDDSRSVAQEHGKNFSPTVTDGNNILSGYDRVWTHVVNADVAPTLTAASPSPSATVAVKGGQAIDIKGTNLYEANAAVVTPAIVGVSPSPASTTWSGPNRTGTKTVHAAIPGVSPVPAVTHAATVVARSATQLTAILPTSAQVGYLVVTNTAGSAQSLGKYAITATTAKVASVPLAKPSASPTVKQIVSPGDTLNVSVANVGSITSAKVVAASPAATYTADFTVVDANNIKLYVPSDFKDGSTVNLTNAGGVTVSAGKLYNPVTADVSGTNGKVGATFTITGTHLSAVSAVKLNGKSATIGTRSDTSISVTIPSGATTGSVVLTVPYGTVTATGTTTVYPAPVVTSFGSSSATRGSSLVINGTNLKPTGTPTVTVDGKAATVTASSSTSITITVPSNATVGSGKLVVVTTVGGTGSKTVTVK